MNPYRVYMAACAEANQNKQASAMEILNHVAQNHHTIVNGLREGAKGLGFFAGGHVGANLLTMGKNAIPKLGEALARSGARYGLQGRKLNPAVESAANNILGPEFLGREFNTAHAQAAKARDLAGGDAYRGLDVLKEMVNSPGRKEFAEHFAPFTRAHEAISKMEHTQVDHTMIPGMHVENTNSPLNRGLAVAGHAASGAAAFHMDPLATVSVAWNGLKSQLLNNRAWRNHPIFKNDTLSHLEGNTGIPWHEKKNPLKFLDIAHESSTGLARGLEHGPDGLKHQIANALISPEWSTFSNIGAKLREPEKHPELAKLFPGDVSTPENRAKTVAHLKSHAGREDFDEGLEAIKDTFQPHAGSKGGLPSLPEHRANPAAIHDNVHFQMLQKDPRGQEVLAHIQKDPKMQQAVSEHVQKAMKDPEIMGHAQKLMEDPRNHALLQQHFAQVHPPAKLQRIPVEA